MPAQSRGLSSPTGTVASLPQTSDKPHASRGLGSHPRAPSLTVPGPLCSLAERAAQCRAPGGDERWEGRLCLHTACLAAGQAGTGRHAGTGAAVKAGSRKRDNNRAPTPVLFRVSSNSISSSARISIQLACLCWSTCSLPVFVIGVPRPPVSPRCPAQCLALDG